MSMPGGPCEIFDDAVASSITDVNMKQATVDGLLTQLDTLLSSLDTALAELEDAQILLDEREAAAAACHAEHDSMIVSPPQSMLHGVAHVMINGSVLAIRGGLMTIQAGMSALRQPTDSK